LPPHPAWLRWYQRVIEGLAGASLAIIVVVMIAQVVARYVFSGSLIWAEEICRYLLIWQTFLLLGLAYQRGDFVMLDFLPAVLTPRARLVLKLVVAVPMVIFLAVVVVTGWRYASLFERQTIPAVDFIWTNLFGHNLGLTVRWIYLSVPVGAALLAAHVIADAIASVIAFRAANHETIAKPDEAI
jgi:TRAP-type C4-dicarboxylate transport system permease small subunit